MKRKRPPGPPAIAERLGGAIAAARSRQKAEIARLLSRRKELQKPASDPATRKHIETKLVELDEVIDRLRRELRHMKKGGLRKVLDRIHAGPATLHKSPNLPKIITSRRPLRG